MNVISNIMVGTGMALILIGVIGLVLSWVCEGEEMADGAGAPTPHPSAQVLTPSPQGEGFWETVEEEEARNGDAV